MSFFEFPYPLLKPVQSDYRVHLADVQDIAAMKISALSGRGTKRDLVDLYAIAVGPIPLRECISLYTKKFSTGAADLYHVLRSLSIIVS